MLPLLILLFFSVRKSKAEVPNPVITLHPGHIGLYDRLLETQYNGNIQVGEPYTLDIYMGNTEEYDYIIERCVFNSRQNFLDNFGCLRKDNVFVQKWETDQYTRPGAVKRTLIHFVASETIINFECQIKVIHCGGCLEQSCERRPTYSYYPTYDMPLRCSYPMGPPIPPVGYPPGGYPQGPPVSPVGPMGWWDNGWEGIPWWLWLLFLLLFLILLCCCICLICFGLRRRKKQNRGQRVYPPPPPPQHRVFSIDGASQTVPELKQASQQVNMRSFGRAHGSVDLRREPPPPNRPTAYDNQNFYDGEFFEEDIEERVTTEYENHDSTRADPSRYGGVPVHRAANLRAQERLQRELEDHLRPPNRADRSKTDFVNRIEEQLYSSPHRRYEPAERQIPIRQSSLI